MILGEGILFEKIEALPGEEVLWKGKADRRGFFSGIFFILAVLLVVALFLTLIINIDTLFFDRAPNPEYVEKSNESGNIVDSTTQQKVVKKKRIRKTIQVANKRNITIFFTILGAYLFITLYLIYLGFKSSFYLITNERIIIQRGYKSKVLTAIDLDKIITIRSSQSWIQKFFKIHSINITVAGIEIVQNGFMRSGSNVIGNIPISENITSKLLNEWLPRDNKKVVSSKNL